MKKLICALAGVLCLVSGEAWGGATVPPAAWTVQPSAGYTLRQQGWSVIGSFAMNLGGATMLTPGGMVQNSVQGATTNFSVLPTVAVPKLRLLFGCWYVNAVPNDELTCPNDIYIAAGVMSPWNTPTGPDPTFNGDKYGRLFSRGLMLSDPINFPVTPGTVFSVRTYCGVTSAAFTCANNPLTIQTTWNASTTEGAIQEDATKFAVSAIGATTNAYSGFGPLAILGFTGTTPAKSLYCAGDSIAAGTGDGSGQRNGLAGYCERIANGVTAVNEQYPTNITATFGFGIGAHSGDTLANFVTAGQHEQQVAVASYFTTVDSNMGTNDLAASLATIKANKLTEAELYVCNNATSCAGVQPNVHFITNTLLPKTTSTDGWITVANQTVTSGESNRIAFNDWLRDTSASGFVAQAAAATGLPASAFGVFDAANAVEVNSSNVLTQDGGFWFAPVGQSAAFTGSVTSGAASNGFTDSTLTAATNTYRGYAVVFTSGGSANFGATISTQTSAGAVLAQGFHATPSVGNTYKLWQQVCTQDGTHPTSWCHQTVAAAFPKALVQ